MIEINRLHGKAVTYVFIYVAPKPIDYDTFQNLKKKKLTVTEYYNSVDDAKCSSYNFLFYFISFCNKIETCRKSRVVRLESHVYMYIIFILQIFVKISHI